MLARLRNGGDAACEALVAAFGPRVLAAARRLVASEEEAREVARLALLDAVREAPGLAGRSSLASWLQRVVVGVALARLRPEPSLRGTVGSQAGPLPGFGPDGSFLDRQAPWRDLPPEGPDCRAVLRAVLEAIASLPGDCRDPLLLHDVEDLSDQLIARELAIGPADARARLHLARQLLRAVLAPHMEALS